MCVRMFQQNSGTSVDNSTKIRPPMSYNLETNTVGVHPLAVWELHSKFNLKLPIFVSKS